MLKLLLDFLDDLQLFRGGAADNVLEDLLMDAVEGVDQYAPGHLFAEAHAKDQVLWVFLFSERLLVEVWKGEELLENVDCLSSKAVKLRYKIMSALDQFQNNPADNHSSGYQFRIGEGLLLRNYQPHPNIFNDLAIVHNNSRVQPVLRQLVEVDPQRHRQAIGG